MTRIGRPSLPRAAPSPRSHTVGRAAAIAWLILALVATPSGADVLDPIRSEPSAETEALIPRFTGAQDSRQRTNSGDRPDHDPIEILTDADLVAGATPVADKGIRGGQGTVDDPYVISNWHISSDEEDGIYVYNTSLHLVIRDLTVVQDTPREQSVGIFLQDARNVTIRNVDISGVHDFGVFSERVVGLPVHGANVSVVPDGDGFDYGVFVRGGSADIERSNISAGVTDAPEGDGSKTRVGVKCQDAEISVQDVDLGGFRAFFSSTIPPSGNSCHAVAFEENRVRPPDDDASLGFFDVRDELDLRGNSGPGVYHVTVGDRIRRATIEGNDIQSLDLEGAKEAAIDYNSEIEVRENRFDGQCNRSSACPTVGLKIQESVHLPVKIVDNRFEMYRVGKVLAITRASFTATGNAFVDNFRGEESGAIAVVEGREEPVASSEEAGGTYQEILGNDFLRHPDDQAGRAIEYRGSAGPLPATSNYWGPDPPVVCQGPRPGGCDERPSRWSIQGEVNIDPWSTTPNVLSESFVQDYFADYDTGNLLPTSHPATVLTTLLLAALATGATRRD